METHPLHPDDIVVKKADSTQLAVVERTPGDIDTHTPYPARTEQEPIHHDKSISKTVFRQFMRDGIPPKDTILVRWQNDPSMELLPASKVKLIDRSFLIGDIVKRNVNDAMSGVVLNTFTKCTLQPLCDVTHQGSQTIKGILPPGKWEPPGSEFCVYPNDKPNLLVDIPASELMYVESPSEDDLVIYKDWIGRVEGITNNIRIKLFDNSVVEILDEDGEHADGSLGAFNVGDVVKTKKGKLRTGDWIYGSYNANTTPIGTVVSLRTITAAVVWLQRRIGSVDEQEPPFVLEAQELQSSDFKVYDRSRQPRHVKSDSSISNSEIDVRLNLRVKFRDLTGACVKYSSTSNRIPRLERMDHLGYDLNVFDVTSFHTDVAVQWQDLTITTEHSIDLVPDGSIDDEHAAWPGEVAHKLGLRPVPGMDHVEQPERVGVVQSVNAAERMARMRWSSASYIHYAKDPEEPGMARPIISHSINPSPSQIEEEEISLYDIEAPAAMNVRRGDIVLIANSKYNSILTRPNDATWLGEIVDTPLDGSLIVRLGAAAEVLDVVLSREETVVGVRSDGTEQPDVWPNDEMGDEIDLGSEVEEDFDEWESEDSLEEDVIVRYEDENGEAMDEDDVENEDWESADEADADDADDIMHDAPEHQTPPTSHSVMPTDTSNATAKEAPSGLADASSAYTVLEGDVPPCHRFRNEPSTEGATHMKRTQREHRILGKSLPSGVFVRTWESRLDLLRVLLVGPTETPYANAPFVVDFYLPPSFPTDPPQAFFHSWPAHAVIGAIGRANPNLYEDGKICLSLLGTWEGNKGEGWSAGRSTLLQVIVSLLGLVLVREPYYNEAGYEALVGTEASKRPSALYSERIYLRAKGFLLTALSKTDTTLGLKGLEDVIRYLYRDTHGPKLLDVTIEDVKAVLAKSDQGCEPDGYAVLSKGACIPLRRVRDRLRELKEQ